MNEDLSNKNVLNSVPILFFFFSLSLSLLEDQLTSNTARYIHFLISTLNSGCDGYKVITLGVDMYNYTNCVYSKGVQAFL